MVYFARFASVFVMLIGIIPLIGDSSDTTKFEDFFKDFDSFVFLLFIMTSCLGVLVSWANELVGYLILVGSVILMGVVLAPFMGVIYFIFMVLPMTLLVSLHYAGRESSRDDIQPGGA